MSGRRLALLVLAVVVAAAAFLAFARFRPQSSGPIEVRLSQAGSPGAAQLELPPSGSRVLYCSVRLVNTSDSPVPLDYADAQLRLYELGREVGGTWGTTNSGATAADGRVIEDSSDPLPAGGRAYAARDFLVSRGLHLYRLVYSIPGYGEFTWLVW